MDVPEHYGDPAAEERFCRETVGIQEKVQHYLTVKGAKVVDFLHRLLSSEVRTLFSFEAQLSCLLNGKGKLVSAFRLFRTDDTTYVLCFGEPLRDEVVGAFTRYGVLDEISVEPKTVPLIGAVGPSAKPLFERTEFAEDPFQPPADPIWRVGSGEWGRLVDESRALGGGPVGTLVADLLRIEAGVPRWGIDFDGSNFPNECGWEDALSYTKGCYIGQEVIARMRTYGHLNKKLFRFRLPGAVEAPPGTKLYLGGKEAGWITSSAASFLTGERCALGYLRQTAWEPETLLAVGSAEGPEAARALPLKE